MVAGGEIRSVDIVTGGVRTIGRAPTGVRAVDAVWNGENILLGGPRLRRMSFADGRVTDLYPVDPGVSFQGYPSFLPDGRRFLYSQESNNPARRGLFLGEIDSTQVSRLFSQPGWAIVSQRGYLLFGRQGTLFAQRFDLDQNRLVGDPVSIASGLDFFGLYAGFAVNGDTLVWSSGTDAPRPDSVGSIGVGGSSPKLEMFGGITKSRLHPMGSALSPLRLTPETGLVCS